MAFSEGVSLKEITMLTVLREKSFLPYPISKHSCNTLWLHRIFCPISAVDHTRASKHDFSSRCVTLSWRTHRPPLYAPYSSGWVLSLPRFLNFFEQFRLNDIKTRNTSIIKYWPVNFLKHKVRDGNITFAFNLQ